MTTYAIADLHVNQIVEIANSDRLWLITSIEKGWISLVEDNVPTDAETRKIRAKQVAMAYVTADDGGLEMPAADPNPAPSHSDPDDSPEDCSDDDDDEHGHSRMASQLARYAVGYVKAKNASNTATKITGDVLSVVSLALEVPQFVAVACYLLGDSTNKYPHLNSGQQRMNYGNRIRAAIKSGKLDLTAVVSRIGVSVGQDLVAAMAAEIEREQAAINTKIAAAELAKSGKAEVKRALPVSKAAKKAGSAAN